MAIMSSNAVWVRYRTTPIVSISIDANTGVYSVHTEDVSYEILDLEKDQKRRKKRIVSTLYMESRILHNPLREEKDPDGHLFADGRYRTKIFASDLPEYFVYGYILGDVIDRGPEGLRILKDTMERGNVTLLLYRLEPNDL